MTRFRRCAVVALTLAAIAAAVLTAPPPASAARSTSVTHALDYLHAKQGSDGRFQDPAYTPWGILAVAASGENPDGSAWTVSGKSPLDYLQSINLASYATQSATGNAAAYYAKMILAYVAAGRGSTITAAGSGKTDLVAKLLSFQRSDGRFSPSSSAPAIAAGSTTTWAIIALCAAQTESSARASAVSWLRDQQLSDGGFTSNAIGSSSGLTSDVDDTAAAIQALVAGGVSTGSSVITDAKAYLKSAQRSDGGFSTDEDGSYTYSESTAWAIQAIYGIGESPTSSAWTKSGSTPWQTLTALQASTGAFYHRKGTLSQPMLSTTQNLVAVAGRTFASWPRGASSWVTPFVATPRVTRFAPLNGATQSSTTIAVRAAYKDPAGGTGIAKSGVRLVVDGHDMTKQAQVTGSALSVDLTGAATGSHKIVLRVHDRAGNVRTETHTVSVGQSSGGTSVGGTSTGDSSTPSDSSGTATEGNAPQTTLPSQNGATAESGAAVPEADLPGQESSPSAGAGGTTQDGNASSSKDESGGRGALFVLGLGLVPAAVGFGVASTQHSRLWEAAQRLRRSPPNDDKRPS